MSDITNPWKLPGKFSDKSPKKGQYRTSSRQSHPFLADDPDAVVGQFHELSVENFSDYGVYLSFGRDRVLLPNKYVPEDIGIGEKIRVFIYTDSEDRPVATTLEPAGVVGDIVALEVKDTAPFGIFMDWGLEKDLLIPRGEQQVRMEPGETHLVKICLDEKSQRVFGSTKIDRLCTGADPWAASNLEPGQEVDLLIHALTPIGVSAIVNGQALGMLYKSDTFEDLAVGDRRRGYIVKLREDGKIDLSLKKPGYGSVEGSAKKILDILEANDGFSPCHDKSSPDEIKNVFAMSKKEFKRAVGNLYKQGQIMIEKGKGIRLK